jgi:hypothetical protein
MKRPALVLFPPRRASWAHPTAARYTHGGTVHPWRHGTPHGGTVHPRRHGTPMAARYTHGGTVHPTAARYTHGGIGTPRRRRTEKLSSGGRAPALLRYPLKPVVMRLPCAHYAGCTPRRVGMDKSLLFCAFRAPTLAGRNAASWNG